MCPLHLDLFPIGGGIGSLQFRNIQPKEQKLTALQLSLSLQAALQSSIFILFFPASLFILPIFLHCLSVQYLLKFLPKSRESEMERWRERRGEVLLHRDEVCQLKLKTKSMKPNPFIDEYKF